MKYIIIIIAFFASTLPTVQALDFSTEKRMFKQKHKKRQLVYPEGFQRKLKSQYVDETFKIYVLLPENYDKNKVGGYPVSYVLDADYFVYTLDHVNAFNTLLPDTIIIGIGYMDSDPDGVKRIRDYSPTEVADVQNSGGADNFRSMLTYELMPRVNRKLNIDQSHETLVSWSLSGLFALDTMFNHGEMFDNYIVSSPYLPWDDYMIFEEEAKYAAANSDLQTRLFLSVGELESVETTKAPFNGLVTTLESRNYPNLLIEDREIEGEAHNTMVAPSFNKGLRHVFSDVKAIKISSSVQQDFLGVYDFFPGLSMTITAKGEMLVAAITGNNGFEMYPTTETQFFSKMVPGLKVTFSRDEHGNIAYVTYDSPNLGVFNGTKRQ